MNSENKTYCNTITLNKKQSIKVQIKYNSRAKHNILRLDPRTDALIITVPKVLSPSKIRRLVEKNANWIVDKLSLLPPKTPFIDGQTFNLMGKNIIICHDPDNLGGVKLNNETLMVSGKVEHISRRIKDWLKKYAHNILVHKVRNMAATLDASFGRISIRDNRSSWGSCSSQGNIAFSWRLIMAPEPVVDYVVAHEVAHLVYLNHSKDFWNTVGSLDANYQESKNWLRINGDLLQRVG